MRVLVTGHNGYIGSVLVPMLAGAGHEVTGLDTFYYEDCTFGPERAAPEQTIRGDIRDVEAGDLEGFDAVVHLAALSNDPLGDLRAEVTYDINFGASVRLAQRAKDAGVARFVFSSSCSLYGASGDDVLDEGAVFNPVTPYGESKVWAERDIVPLADDDFSPTFLRNATGYGTSPRLRTDVVVNNLVGHAVTTGQVLLQTDGSQWRPLVHIADISRAFLAVLEAPRDAVHAEAFNVGSTAENYRIRDVAEIIERIVPDARVTLSGDVGPDLRNYRVSCDKFAEQVGFQTEWTVERGVREALDAFVRDGLTYEDLTGPRTQRLPRIRQLVDDGLVDDDLRWRVGALAP
jgi:nucleoside-diphosphate-sugar epimerase